MKATYHRHVELDEDVNIINCSLSDILKKDKDAIVNCINVLGVKHTQYYTLYYLDNGDRVDIEIYK